MKREQIIAAFRAYGHWRGPGWQEVIPLRPWWFRDAGGWSRIGDGFADSERKAAELDRSYPRECPPPAVGQVWLVPDPRRPGCALECPVRSIWHSPWGRVVDIEIGPGPDTWPPSGGILVGGPGAPWAPVGFDEEVTP